jgi:hypothetical protein
MLACSTSPKSNQGRVVLENSLKGEDMPNWVSDTKTNWEQDNNLYFKSSYTIAGNQRVNGCWDLAKLDMKESLLSELSQDIKGEINLANEGISEGLDPLITKSIRTNIEGQVRGLKTQEQLFERYTVNHVERIDCFVMGSMTKADYALLKNSVLKNLSSVSAEVAEAVRKRQKDFFTEKKE